MALSFPLSLASFFGEMCHIAASFHLPPAVVTNRRADGELVVAGYGARLWEGTVELKAETPQPMEDILALLRALERPDAIFAVTPRHARIPRAESTGPVAAIQSINASRRQIAIGSLPVGFTLSRGDYLSFITGTGDGQRFHLHQLVEGAAANGSGVTVQLEIVPDLHPAVTTALPVALLQPRCLARVIPGSVEVSSHPRRGFTDGARFAWRQTYR